MLVLYYLLGCFPCQSFAIVFSTIRLCASLARPMVLVHPFSADHDKDSNNEVECVYLRSDLSILAKVSVTEQIFRTTDQLACVNIITGSDSKHLFCFPIDAPCTTVRFKLWFAEGFLTVPKVFLVFFNQVVFCDLRQQCFGVNRFYGLFQKRIMFVVMKNRSYYRSCILLLFRKQRLWCLLLCLIMIMGAADEADDDDSVL